MTFSLGPSSLHTNFGHFSWSSCFEYIGTFTLCKEASFQVLGETADSMSDKWEELG